MLDKTDLHTHTIASGHAYSTRKEMIEAAATKGLEVYAITEHAPAMPGSCNSMYFMNYRALPRKHGEMTVLYGVELNILDYEGHVDLPESILKEMDLALAERVRNLRKRKKISQQVLSQKSGVSLGSLKRFEQTGQISLLSLTRLAVALGVGNEIRKMFTEIPYESIEEVINENR